MDYLVSFSAIVKGFFVALATLLTYLASFRTGAAAGIELQPLDRPPGEGEENPPRRDPNYYYLPTTIVFRIQGTLFRVHEDFLISEQSTLRSRVRQSRLPRVHANGSSDARAIVLDEIPITEFRALLHYFYHERIRRLTRTEEVAYLRELLAVTDRIKMGRIYEYAVQRLYALRPPLPPLERILLCRQYELSRSRWLYPAVVELIERVEPLDMYEAEEAGWELLQKIAWMREVLSPSRDEHGALTSTQAQLLRFVSGNFEGRTLYTSLTVRRRITE